MTARLDDTAAALRVLGITRVHSYAWRDLDDPEAGGSEVHADEILQRWAKVGIEIVHRTSSHTMRRTFERNGYEVVQEGSRTKVQLRTPWEGWRRDRKVAHAVVDIWNGLPWWSPVWFQGPRITWLHHVHGPLWGESFPRRVALPGRLIEARVAPRLYREGRIVTLARSGVDDLMRLGFERGQIDVIEPGVSDVFRPNPQRRSPTPLVVVVGRLAMLKRPLDIVHAVSIAREQVPDLQLEIIGDGPDRAKVAAGVRLLGAEEWCTLRGRLEHAEVVQAYQRAWAFASASQSEGWGMVLTEAAACGTPAVASRTVGHVDAVAHGRSGLLFDDVEGCAAALVKLMRDSDYRRRLQAGALAFSERFSWDRAAAMHLSALLAEARAHKMRRG